MLSVLKMLSMFARCAFTAGQYTTHSGSINHNINCTSMLQWTEVVRALFEGSLHCSWSTQAAKNKKLLLRLYISEVIGNCHMKTKWLQAFCNIVSLRQSITFCCSVADDDNYCYHCMSLALYGDQQHHLRLTKVKETGAHHMKVEVCWPLASLRAAASIFCRWLCHLC